MTRSALHTTSPAGLLCSFFSASTAFLDKKESNDSITLKHPLIAPKKVMLFNRSLSLHQAVIENS